MTQLNPARANTDTIGERDLKILAEFVLEDAGIVIQPHQYDRLRRIARAACDKFELNSVADYLNRLRSQHAFSAEREFLMAGVTIGESYFFRDENHIGFLRDTWIPYLKESKQKSANPSIHVWSAGCSNGQEAYTIAILLQETIPDIDRWDVRILATDINTEVLRTGMTGRYSDWSFRATPERIRTNYFTEEDGIQVLNEKTRSMVTFSYHNLIENNYPSLLTHTAGLDLILCRNVFIYFVRESVERVMHKFVNCLSPGGHLLVGVSDPVPMEVDGLTRHYAESTSFFRKPRADEAPPPATISARPVDLARKPGAAPLTARPRPTGTPRAPLSTPAAPNTIANRARPAPAREPSRFAPAAPSPAAVRPPAASVAAGRDLVLDLMRTEDWPGVLTAVGTMENSGQLDSDLQRCKVKALANMGRRQAALDACDKLLELDSTDKHNQFLVGLVRLDGGDIDLAEKALRRSLFLDRDFLEAHYQLGMLLVSQGRKPAGLKSLKNALALAEKTPPDRVMHESAGTTAARMVEVLRQYLAVYKEQ